MKRYINIQTYIPDGIPPLWGEVRKGLFLICLLLVACTSETMDEAPDEGMCQLNLTVCLQPERDMAIEAGTTRAMGDPGTEEHFDKPRYFYVYVVGFTAAVDDPGKVFPLKVGVGEPKTEVNRIDVGGAEWNSYDMFVDPPQTLHDSILGCTQQVTFKLEGEENITNIKKLRIYVAASPVPLKYNGHELGVKIDADNQVLGNTHHESDVLGLRFDVDDDLLAAGLQNVYSSPYNYAPVKTYGGEYYYTINEPTKTEDITRIIYHVAAKVDVMWNVDPAKQADVRISHIEARKLKKKGCLLFRPTENTWDNASDGLDGNHYTKVLLDGSDPSDLDVGRQWYGRQYFYTIPFRNTGVFDLNLHVLKNGDDVTTYQNSGYNLTIHKNLGTAFDIFVPWLRNDLVVTSDLTYN